MIRQVQSVLYDASRSDRVVQSITYFVVEPTGQRKRH